jgi:hypothetical protein
VQEEAYLDLRHYAFHAGDFVDLVGGGFAPGEAVSVFVSGSPQQDLATLTADAKGKVASDHIAVPKIEPGDHTLVAEGTQTGLVVRRQVSVLGYTPWLVLSSYALQPGESVDASGNGFAPGETVSAVVDDAATPAQQLKADKDGRVLARGVYVARPEDAGKHRLTLAGDTTRAPVSATLEVLSLVPQLGLSPYQGPPGTKVTLSGGGFAPGETVRLYVEAGGQRTEVASFAAGSDGGLGQAGAYLVPSTADVGKLRLTVVGDRSKVPVYQDFDVQSQPTSLPSPTATTAPP